MFPETNRDRMESYQHKSAKTSLQKKVRSYPKIPFLFHKSTRNLLSLFFPKKKSHDFHIKQRPSGPRRHPRGIQLDAPPPWAADIWPRPIGWTSPNTSTHHLWEVSQWKNALLCGWISWVYLRLLSWVLSIYWFLSPVYFVILKKIHFPSWIKKLRFWSSSMNGPHRAAQWITRGGMIHAGQVAISGFLALWIGNNDVWCGTRIVHNYDKLVIII